jgi:hypothetical protein
MKINIVRISSIYLNILIPCSDAYFFSKNKKWEWEPFASYFVKTESKKYQKILISFNTCWNQCWVVLTFFLKNPLILVFEKEVLIIGLIALIIVVQALENWLGYKFFKCFYKANLKMSVLIMLRTVKYLLRFAQTPISKFIFKNLTKWDFFC